MLAHLPRCTTTQNWRELGALLNLGVHCHFGGRPLMSAVFNKTLKYLKSCQSVWFAQQQEVVDWLVAHNVGNQCHRER